MTRYKFPKIERIYERYVYKQTYLNLIFVKPKQKPTKKKIFLKKKEKEGNFREVAYIDGPNINQNNNT